MQCTMTPPQSDALVEQLQVTLGDLIATFVAHLTETPLEQLEAQVQQVSQQMAQQVLQQTVQTVTPRSPAPAQMCACGHEAAYQRQRAATVRTLVGAITYRRAYYLCPACHQGYAPLDQALGWCAGSLSAPLQHQAALLGASLPYAQASQVLATLTQVSLSAPTIRHATQQVGQCLSTLPAEPPATPLGEPLYLSADGCMVSLRQEGWKEVRVGCGYTSQPHYTTRGVVLQAWQQRYLAHLGELAEFGERFWQASMGSRAGAPGRRHR